MADDFSQLRKDWRAAKEKMTAIDPGFPKKFRDGLGPTLDDFDKLIKQAPEPDDKNKAKWIEKSGKAWKKKGETYCVEMANYNKKYGDIIKKYLKENTNDDRKNTAAEELRKVLNKITLPHANSASFIFRAKSVVVFKDPKRIDVKPKQ